MFLKYKIQLQKYLLSYINSKNDQKNDYNQNTVPKLENLAVLHNQNLKFVSSVLARKLKCPSSARLGSETSQLGLAQAGKFQLEPISNKWVKVMGQLIFAKMYVCKYGRFCPIPFFILQTSMYL